MTKYSDLYSIPRSPQNGYTLVFTMYSAPFSNAVTSNSTKSDTQPDQMKSGSGIKKNKTMPIINKIITFTLSIVEKK